MYYPKYVYNIREDITRANMRAYDQKQKEIEKKCLEINPDYYKCTLRDRMETRQRAANLLGVIL